MGKHMPITIVQGVDYNTWPSLHVGERMGRNPRAHSGGLSSKKFSISNSPGQTESGPGYESQMYEHLWFYK